MSSPRTIAVTVTAFLVVGVISGAASCIAVSHFAILSPEAPSPTDVRFLKIRETVGASTEEDLDSWLALPHPGAPNAEPDAEVARRIDSGRLVIVPAGMVKVLGIKDKGRRYLISYQANCWWISDETVESKY